MNSKKFGPFSVSSIGLGCMNLNHAYGVPPSPEQGERVLLAALDAGLTMFDTAALYGLGNNETLLGKVLKGKRSQFTLASKGGMAGVDVAGDGKLVRVIDGRPETVRKNCEDSLRRLQTDVIDLYYLHRWDKKVPIEDSVGAMADLVSRGHVRAIGLSEVSAATIKKAHAVHPISAVQTEYSLWTRNPEIAVLALCKEIGATFVAFSPVARGFLTDAPPAEADIAANDIRKTMPRFMGDNYVANLKLLSGLKALANEAGCTPAQLSLAWLLQKAEHIIPIPGTRSVEHLKEDIAAADIKLSTEVIQRAEALINQKSVAGARYNALATSEVDTESFA
jgi:aryl-alcohol dehydrogenase-like predicted oxidoreductase